MGRLFHETAGWEMKKEKQNRHEEEADGGRGNRKDKMKNDRGGG
jgi:hypothetical protein